MTTATKSEEDTVQDWFFSFGVGHFLGKTYVRFRGTFHSARHLMVTAFGDHWCAQYAAPEQMHAKEWCLRELVLDASGFPTTREAE